MKQFTILIFIAICFFGFCVDGYASYREYLVFGVIVDNNSAPIEGVTVRLDNREKQRGFRCKTDKKGKFKYAGLPHGTYDVTLKKDGYKTKTLEWDLRQKQNRMQKVDYHTIVMLSDKQSYNIEVGKKLKKGFAKARELIDKKDYDGAIKILEELVKAKPGEAAVIYLLGACHLYKKQYEAAIPLFAKVVELDPSFPGGHFQLGVCYQRTNKLEQALDKYKKTLELEPGNAAAVYNCGLILYGMEKPAEAIPYFEKSLTLTPNDPDILEMTGLCYLRGEQYDKALDSFKKAKTHAKDKEKQKRLTELITETGKMVK